MTACIVENIKKRDAADSSDEYLLFHDKGKRILRRCKISYTLLKQTEHIMELIYKH